MEELDPFSVASVLERINNREDRPRYLDGALQPAVETCYTTDFSVFAEDGTINVLPYTPRGAPLPQNRLKKRRANKIEIPGFGEGFTVNTEQRRDVAAIPTETQIVAGRSIVDRHLDQVDANMGATEERQLAHAVRGFITDLEDEEILIDLYDELGAEQQTFEIDCTDSKVNWVRQLQAAYDMVDDGLTGDVANSYLMLPGNGIGKWLQSDATYIQASTSETAVRLALEDNRKGTRVNSSLSVLPSRKGYFEAFECHLVPVGVPGFFKKVLGPSDSEQYEGQVLETYVTREPIPHGMGWEYQLRRFVLQYARKPRAIVKLKFLGIPGGPSA